VEPFCCTSRIRKVPSNHRVSVLCSSSGSLNTRRHDVPETGQFPSSGEGTKTFILLGPFQKANFNYWSTDSKGPNRVDLFLPHLRMETEQIFEMLCFLVFRISDDGQGPGTQ
jgi:hypothetical protein